MEKESLRISDTEKEKIIASFLDEKLYSKLEFANFERITDRTNQLKGIDVKIKHADFGDLIVDEKAQIHYIDKNLPTYAFEIDFKNYQDKLITGWLFDENKETNYYLLMWIWTHNGNLEKKEDIKQIECFLINRKDIIDFLNKQGLNKDSCKSISEDIRKTKNQNRFYKENITGCYFYLTSHLVENPVNVIIYKNNLRELSKKVFILD